jgi:hypothetical protein
MNRCTCTRRTVRPQCVFMALRMTQWCINDNQSTLPLEGMSPTLRVVRSTNSNGILQILQSHDYVAIWTGDVSNTHQISTSLLDKKGVVLTRVTVRGREYDVYGRYSMPLEPLIDLIRFTRREQYAALRAPASLPVDESCATDYTNGDRQPCVSSPCSLT